MKRLLIMLSIAAIVLSGCGKTAQEPVSKGVVSMEHALSDLIPNPSDVFGDIQYDVVVPDNGERYQFIIDNGTKSMFDEYVKVCKNGYFSEYNCDLDTNYQAYTPEGTYWTSVSFFPGTTDDPYNTYIYVDVKKVNG